MWFGPNLILPFRFVLRIIIFIPLSLSLSISQLTHSSRKRRGDWSMDESTVLGRRFPWSGVGDYSISLGLIWWHLLGSIGVPDLTCICTWWILVMVSSFFSSLPLVLDCILYLAAQAGKNSDATLLVNSANATAMTVAPRHCVACQRGCVSVLYWSTLVFALRNL